MNTYRHQVSHAALVYLGIGLAFALTSCSGNNDANSPEPAVQPPPLSALQELIGPSLVDRTGAEQPTDSLRQKLIGLYFAAQWDPPSCYFTPRLIEFYETMAQEHKPFEVILISEDRSAEDMMIHLHEMNMPWQALPYTDGSRQIQLRQQFAVTTLPVLIILDDAAQIITTDGRADVMRQNGKAYEVWR